MNVISGEVITGQQIEIDDKKFVNCVISDCVLVYSGKPVVFHSTRLERCRYVFFGDAEQIVRFLQSMGLLIGTSRDWLEYNGNARVA